MENEAKPQDHLTVTNFRTLGTEDLADLAAALSLSLPAAQLQTVRRWFAERLHRDPLIGELRFLDTWGKLCAELYDNAALSTLAFEEEDTARAYRDVCRQWAALGEKQPPLLRDAAAVSGRYLARCGVFAPLPRFSAVPAAEAAAREATVLAKEGDAVAAVLPAVGAPRADTTALVALTLSDDPAADVTAFLERHRTARPVFLAVTGEEGLLPHVLTLPGVALDAMQLYGYAAGDAATLCGAVRHRALFLVSQGALAQLFDGETPLALCGSLRYGGELLIREGARAVVTLPFALLALWRMPRTGKCRVPREVQTPPPRAAIDACGGLRVAHLTAVDRVCAAVTGAAADLLAAGATPDLTLSTLLFLPLGTDPSRVLPLLLGLHRAAAELALPAGSHRIVFTAKTAPLRLSVFLAAAARPAPDERTRAALLDAASAEDFAALRRLKESL